MEPETEDQGRAARSAAVDRLRPSGFRPLGRMLFRMDAAGVTYDLSAADLDRIDRIESDGLFVVPDGAVHARVEAMSREWQEAHR